MLLTAYARLRSDNFTSTVVLDSEDTDVYVQAAYVSHQLAGKLLMKRKHDFIDCRAMLPEEVSKVIIPLHVITGGDHTSGFYGHGKKDVLQKAMNDPGARNLLARVGEKLVLDEGVRTDMKGFVVSQVYGESVDASCGEARASKWQKLKKKSTIRLPPDNDSLDQHIERTNYIVYCQTHFCFVEHPSPIGHGWEIINGKCRPVRHTLPPFPHKISLGTFFRTSEITDDSSADDGELEESTDSDEV